MAHDCRTCNGTGRMRCPRCGGDGKTQGERCHYCHGEGTVVCKACDGTGRVED